VREGGKVLSEKKGAGRKMHERKASYQTKPGNSHLPGFFKRGGKIIRKKEKRKKNH